MQSLRTQRPTEAKATPRPRQPTKARPGNNARKSTVDDKIKKRMSMRYADISGPTDLNIPAVPSLPSSVKPKEREQDEVVRDRSMEADVDPWLEEKKKFEKEEFDPDAYLRTKLANSTESETKSLQSSLRGFKDDTASELQRNVFKNYAELVTISKEISTLENEMLELKENLAEWKSMPSLLHVDDSTSTAERRRNARSSVADLRVIYANQMQTLHSQIEGSSKFAPTTPGRHVITEMDGILALNAATFRVERTVRFVVLDDLVLVARRRRRNAGVGVGTNMEGGKLVAERCWPLNEMLVLDTKDTPSMTHVFKIKHNRETHVYRTESASDKKSLLSTFRHVAEELAAKKRKEREGEHERRKSLWAGGDRNSFMEKMPPLPDWMAEISKKLPGDGNPAKEKDELDARWISEFSDDLTVAIALRQWEKAVSLVEKGKEKLTSTPQLAPKLTALTASLTSALLLSLSSLNNRKSTVMSLVSLLVRLDAGLAARKTFLASRSETMRKHIRAIRFEGHIGMYVSDLSMVVFAGIKHTADWFLASFNGNEVASCFIEWAKKQIEDYAELFRIQVYGSDVDPKTVDSALRITHNQSKKLLQDFGLDFRYLLDELLKEHPKKETIVHATFQVHEISVKNFSTPTISEPAPAPRAVSPASTIQVREASRTKSTDFNETPTLSEPSPVPRAASPASTSRSRTSSSRVRPPNVPPPLPDIDLPLLNTPLMPTPRRPHTPLSAATPRSASFDGPDAFRSPRSNPTPPPRSSNRPSLGPRAPPTAVPKREGMF